MTQQPNRPQLPVSGMPLVEANVGAGFWHKGPNEPLPPPDMMGPYMRGRAVPTRPVEGRKAWIIGSGIAATFLRQRSLPKAPAEEH